MLGCIKWMNENRWIHLLISELIKHEFMNNGIGEKPLKEGEYDDECKMNGNKSH